MAKDFATCLEDRGLLRISGEDRTAFLQGLVSNDVCKVGPELSLWAAFLTPQGKYLHDFFLCEWDGSFLLECERDRLEDLKTRLARFRLRAKVTLEDLSDELGVIAAWGAEAACALSLSGRAGETKRLEGGGLAFVDPRSSAMGLRIILARSRTEEFLQEHFQKAAREDYDALRITLGLPDGSRDMEIERAILLENGFDELGGIDWQKGCFIGQELTARTKYRALIKKRLLPLSFESAAPESGCAVTSAGREVGTIRSSSGNRALALLRLEALESSAPLEVAGQSAKVETPAWLNLEQSKEARPQP